MKVEIRLDPDCESPKVIIVAAEMTEEIQALANTVAAQTQSRPAHLMGYTGGSAQILEPTDIVRIYASAQKLFAVIGDREYALKARLYEMEEQLDPKLFVRISQSELINLKQVEKFELNLQGTICVKFKNGQVSYVARRHVVRIKKTLGM